MDTVIDWIIWFAADGAMIAAFLMAMYAFLFVVPMNKWWYWGWRIALAGITAYLAAKLLAHFYQPNDLRPYEKLGVDPKASYLDNPGFPSDHMLFATFLTLAVWFSTKRWFLAGSLTAMAIIIGLGRVFALVHAPIDIIGGLLIPFVGVFWYLDYRQVRQKVVK